MTPDTPLLFGPRASRGTDPETSVRDEGWMRSTAREPVQVLTPEERRALREKLAPAGDEAAGKITEALKGGAFK